MLIDPPNKANAQENTKIFPGLRPQTPRLRGGRWGFAPDPNATPSGSGALRPCYMLICSP